MVDQMNSMPVNTGSKWKYAMFLLIVSLTANLALVYKVTKGNGSTPDQNKKTKILTPDQGSNAKILGMWQSAMDPNDKLIFTADQRLVTLRGEMCGFKTRGWTIGDGNRLTIDGFMTEDTGPYSSSAGMKFDQTGHVLTLDNDILRSGNVYRQIASPSDYAPFEKVEKGATDHK